VELDEAAGLLGVHYMTAYGWVRQGRLPARKRGGRYDVSAAAVARLRAERERAVRPADRQVRDWSSPVAGLLEALITGDESSAGRLVRAQLRSGASSLALCEDLIAPSLRAIGDAWACGELNVAHEHRASAICSRLLGPIAGPRPGRPRGRAVVLSAPGDRHRLPALMATIALREARWRVDHLDIDVPRGDLLEFIHGDRPDLVVISSAHPPATKAARRLATVLTAARVRTLVGVPGASLAELQQRAVATDAAAGP
jgi:excisionase family DNA binding protein